MYVCVCNALTDRDVRAAEAAGAAGDEEVFRHYGVPRQCGRCAAVIRSMMGAHARPGNRRPANDGTPPAPDYRRHHR